MPTGPHPSAPGPGMVMQSLPAPKRLCPPLLVDTLTGCPGDMGGLQATSKAGDVG